MPADWTDVETLRRSLNFRSTNHSSKIHKRDWWRCRPLCIIASPFLYEHAAFHGDRSWQFGLRLGNNKLSCKINPGLNKRGHSYTVCRHENVSVVQSSISNFVPFFHTGTTLHPMRIDNHRHDWKESECSTTSGFVLVLIPVKLSWFTVSLPSQSSILS